MKERPILFSAPMVHAIIEGRKTQTRRVANKLVRHPDFGYRMTPNVLIHEREPQHVIDRACPYGQPGDKLWVREKFQPLFADGVENHYETDWKTGKGYKISYPATDGVQEFINLDDELSDACKPSIHMPRWASRILLEITAVRIERLNDISLDDAKAEGVEQTGVCPGLGLYRNYLDPLTGYIRPDDSFSSLWNSINGPGSWDANPWVWVVEFKREQS